MSDRWSARAPLTGLMFIALVIVGGPVLEGSRVCAGEEVAA